MQVKFCETKEFLSVQKNEVFVINICKMGGIPPSQDEKESASPMSVHSH